MTTRREDRRSSRTPLFATLGVIAGIAFGVGAVLQNSSREWSCTNRYWTDNSRNTKAYVPGVLIAGGIVVGVGVAVAGTLAFWRTRRPAALISVAIGLIPLIVGVTVVLLVPYDSWRYPCTTD